MTTITLATVIDAIATVLGAATTVERTESYNELTEGIHDFPMLQVYWESVVQDPESGTERTTFGGGVRQTDHTIHADYYARQRSNIGEDMAALVNGIEAITNRLESQGAAPPFFGVDVKAFRWRGDRVTFNYGDPQIMYVGARFILTVRLF